jgi:hypothetical protein
MFTLLPSGFSVRVQVRFDVDGSRFDVRSSSLAGGQPAEPNLNVNTNPASENVEA